MFSASAIRFYEPGIEQAGYRLGFWRTTLTSNTCEAKWSVMSARMRVLHCYKQMLREGQKFTDYNFRNYALRRVKDGFRDSRGETDPQKVEVLLEKAEQNLNMMKRQAVISQLYTHRASVVEQPNKQS